MLRLALKSDSRNESVAVDESLVPITQTSPSIGSCHSSVNRSIPPDQRFEAEARNPFVIRDLLSRNKREQDAHDRDADFSHLRKLLNTALEAESDIAMIEVLQLGRDEMPDAIRTLQQVLTVDAGGKYNRVVQYFQHISSRT